MNFLELSKKYPEIEKILDSVCVVDVGNTFVKTDTGISIPSTVTEVTKFEDSIDPSASKVEWNKKMYVVGSKKGALNMEADKYKSDHYKVSLFSAIANNFGTESKNIDVRLGLGLPAKFYNDHNVELKSEIKALDKQTITIDGNTHIIKILDVEVFKQGGTLNTEMIEEFKYPLMLLDFGGGTLDISYWEKTKDKFGKKVLCMSDSRSFSEFGFELVMSELATKCNSSAGSDGKYTIHDVIGFLEDKELPFGDDNTLQSLRDSLFGEYCKSVVSKIGTELKPNTCKDIRLIGGPANELLEYIKPLFPKGNPSLVDEERSQHVNAQIFANRYKELLTAEYLINNKEVAVTTEV